VVRSRPRLCALFGTPVLQNLILFILLAYNCAQACALVRAVLESFDSHRAVQLVGRRSGRPDFFSWISKSISSFAKSRTAAVLQSARHQTHILPLCFIRASTIVIKPILASRARATDFVTVGSWPGLFSKLVKVSVQVSISTRNSKNRSSFVFN